MFVPKYQPCPVQDVCLEYAGPLVSVAVIIAVVYCCLLQLISLVEVATFDLTSYLTCCVF